MQAQDEARAAAGAGGGVGLVPARLEGTQLVPVRLRDTLTSLGEQRVEVHPTLSLGGVLRALRTIPVRWWLQGLA